ncbi:MAG: PfkB family carbohydrate kinase [Candidatus Melainabacteria bacterium]|nr:PfkB family carbohydrate kinase [Candidatus Melainabacteria bacterium]
MKYELTETESKKFGAQLSALLNEFNREGEIDRNFLQECQGIFFGFDNEENGHELQNKHYSSKLWKIVSKWLPPELNEEHDNFAAETYQGPIIVETKGGLDIIIDASTQDGHFHVDSYNVDKGGLGPNTAEAMYHRGQEFNLIALYGQGLVANIQEKLLGEVGIKPHIVRHRRDTNFHPCINFKDEQGEFLGWMVAQVYPMHEWVLDEFTNKIDEVSQANPGEFMVLTNTPPRGANPDYFAKLSKIANKNQNMVIYNPCEWVDTYLADRYLFKQGHADIVKPNLHEFFQFLVSLDIIDAADMIDRRKQIKTEIDAGNFSNLSTLLDQFMQASSCEIAIVSLDKDGVIVASMQDQVHIPAPVIQLECSSGAGDSGLAGLIAAAKEVELDLFDISQEDLIKIATEFVYSASATAAKKGNQLARPDEIAVLKESAVVIPKVLVKSSV